MTLSPRIHVIAEAGNNHNGNLETGKRLIETAARSGADSVKFQIINPEGLYLPKVWDRDQAVPNEVFEQRKQLILTDDDYRTLSEFAKTNSIALSASVFDEAGLALLTELGPPYIKIASCDLNNHPLLERTAATGIPIVVSTGMSTLDDVERAVEVLTKTKSIKFVLLHCVSIYPASIESMNLRFIQELKSNFDCEVGLSDHTEGSIAASVAIGMGATWIEKHFTLDRSQPGFDHAYALEPDQFREYVSDLRCAESSIAGDEDKLSLGELETRKRARRGLYAAVDIPEGHRIAPEDVLIVRPEGPMQPGDLARVIGAKSKTLIRAFQPFVPEQLGD